jgi:hypothetical protein
VLQLPQRPGLDLPNSLARQRKLLANFLQCEYYDIKHIFINRNDVATCEVRNMVTQRELPSGAAMKENAQSSARRPHEIARERGFAALRQFKSREGHCRVPRGHEEGNFKLGTWVVNQRNRRNNLSVERKQRLKAIGFVWRLK